MSAGIVLLTVALGSLGAVVRYLVQSLWLDGRRPYGAIVLVNVVGSSLAGALAALPDSPATAPLLVGLCAGLTTFSTLVVHLLTLPDSPPLLRRVLLGALHMVGSLGGCALAYEAVRLVAG